MGGFVLSLDFELMWGMKGSETPEIYRPRLLGVRQAIPRMLDLLERHEIGCTWATVGFLFFEDRDSLLAALPDVRPSYRDPRHSTYTYLDDVGPDERSDPFHFGRSLVREIARYPRQEIATHTFSHLYCLEDGHTIEAFDADLAQARRVAEAEDIRIRSIVFPRNQVNPDVLATCKKYGVEIYRGAGVSPGAGGLARGDESLALRGVRLANSYAPLSLSRPAPISRHDGMTNVPGSSFLRPYSRQLAFAEQFRVGRILRAMRKAARRGGLFHLWFHPHNFGVNLDENFSAMTMIVAEAKRLRETYGWPTVNMAEAHDLLVAPKAKVPVG